MEEKVVLGVKGGLVILDALLVLSKSQLKSIKPESNNIIRINHESYIGNEKISITIRGALSNHKTNVNNRIYLNKDQAFIFKSPMVLVLSYNDMMSLCETMPDNKFQKAMDAKDTILMIADNNTEIDVTLENNVINIEGLSLIPNSILNPAVKNFYKFCSDIMLIDTKHFNALNKPF